MCHSGETRAVVLPLQVHCLHLPTTSEGPTLAIHQAKPHQFLISCGTVALPSYTAAGSSAVLPVNSSAPHT